MLWGVLQRVGDENLIVVEHVHSEGREACGQSGVREVSGKRCGFECGIEDVDARVAKICGEKETSRAVGEERETFINRVGARIEIRIVHFKYGIVAAGPSGDSPVLARENKKCG